MAPGRGEGNSEGAGAAAHISSCCLHAKQTAHVYTGKANKPLVGMCNAIAKLWKTIEKKIIMQISHIFFFSIADRFSICLLRCPHLTLDYCVQFL